MNLSPFFISYYKTLFAILIVSFLPLSAYATGIGVSHAKLNFDVKAGESISKSIQIMNTGKEVSRYRIYVDDNFKDCFNFSPKEFKLNPDQTQSVEISINYPSSLERNVSLYVYVVSLPTSGDLKIGSGIKIPVKVSVQANPFFKPIYFIGVMLLFGMLAGYKITKRKNRRKGGLKTVKTKKAFFLIFFLTIILFSGCIQDYEPLQNSEPIYIIVTKDFGKEMILSKTVYFYPKKSVLDALREVAEVDTAYGGSFVKGINGIESQFPKVHKDWFFYVNGISSSVGASEYLLNPGDVIQWDFHVWNDKFIPAIIGCFPEPFLHGYKGETYPTVIVYSYDLKEIAEKLKVKLIEHGVKDVSIKEDDLLSEQEKRHSNLIILGTADSPLISELNGLYDKIGFSVYFEEGGFVLDSKRDITARYNSAGVIQATQNPWNPKGIGACENVLLVITGTDEGEVKNSANILIHRSNENEIRNAFAIVVVEDNLIRVPQ